MNSCHQGMNMKEKLENILNLVKAIGRNAKEHWKETLAAIALPFVLSLNTNAANIEAHNYSSDNPNISSRFIFKTSEGYQEWHGPEDALFLDCMPPRLEIFSDPNGRRYSLDGRPPQTPGVEMHLKVRGIIIGPLQNSLWIKVTDDSDLEHRKVIVYDVSNPGEIYNVDTTPEEWTEVRLPDVVDKQDEVYATWHIATPALVPGDIASDEGVGKLDGKVDFYDLEALCDRWLDETLEGENYSWGDFDYNRINNFIDFEVIGGSWMEGD